MTREVRQLIDKDLKTTTAWSPDSRKLAIGDSPGYGNIYPLVIVDADTGVIDKTGVQGAGPSWSPDGRSIAVSTGFHQGEAGAAVSRSMATSGSTIFRRAGSRPSPRPDLTTTTNDQA